MDPEAGDGMIMDGRIMDTQVRPLFVENNTIDPKGCHFLREPH